MDPPSEWVRGDVLPLEYWNEGVSLYEDYSLVECKDKEI